MSPLTGADRIARALSAAGCRDAFGVPGGEVLDLLAALRRQGLRFTLVRHENAGGFMAEGTHHVTGAPGVLLATVGPGVANTVNVVANAQQDRVPLIVLTGCVNPALAATYTHQVFDHRAVLAPITKASLQVVSGAVEATVDRALSIAMDGQPGPVHLDVPIEVARDVEPELDRPRRARPLPSRPLNTDAITSVLSRAARPLVIAGLDALDASSSLRAFAAAWGAPVLTTYKAKGLFDERDPLSVGAFGLSPKADTVLAPFVREADMVLLVGYDPIEVRAPWREPFSPDAEVIALSREPDRHGVHRIDHLIVGHVGASLDALHPKRVAGGSARAELVREALDSEFEGATSWGPDAIVSALGTLPDDTRLTCDTGAHRILVSQRLVCTWPRQLLQSTGLCTMGCALPLAIGAKLAEPTRRVVALMGDGGLEMVLGEVATLRELGLAIGVLVVDDRSLALIEKKQRALGHPNAGVDFGGTDFVAVARAFGGEAARIESREDLEAHLSSAPEGRWRMLHCPFERQAYDGRI
ncbi:MAG: thiamine pyrophosphate-binding protein [Sandaracinaceae bacterium]